MSAGYGDTLNPYASKTANTFLAAPNGSAGVPSFRAVVAADIPTLNQNTTGSSGSCTGNAATATTATTATSSSIAGGVVWENHRVISANYTMTASKSGISAGPITINSGITVTIPSGGRWVVL